VNLLTDRFRLRIEKIGRQIIIAAKTSREKLRNLKIRRGMDFAQIASEYAIRKEVL
jgi:hypothetical protein